MTKEISLDEFLAPISNALGRTAVPQEVEPCPSLGEMPRRVHAATPAEIEARFISAAEAMHVHVHRCKRDEAGAVIAGIVAEGENPSAVVPRDPRVVALGIESALQQAQAGCSMWDPQAGEEACRELCLNAGFGITFPSAAIAETGTVVQPCNEECGRSISLLPETHIAVIEAAAIVAQMSDALSVFAQSGGEAGRSLPSQICFISGPSNTSDIELVRVEGVHGPMYVHYVVIEA